MPPSSPFSSNEPGTALNTSDKPYNHIAAQMTRPQTWLSSTIQIGRQYTKWLQLFKMAAKKGSHCAKRPPL
jgi:hypothetical protein